MARFLEDREKSQGQAPGSLIFIGQQKMDKPEISLMDFSKKHLDELELSSIDDVIPYLSKNSVSWINIYGLHDVDLIKRIGEIFNLDSLFLEDMLNTDQMPKFDDGQNYDGFILKMLYYDNLEKQINTEQLTLVLGKNYVLTIQEQRGDLFEPVRMRIRHHKGRVRLNNNDYLAYALLDTIVDRYMIIVEAIGRQVETVEKQIFNGAERNIEKSIYHNKIEISYLRKNIRPLIEIGYYLLKSAHTNFKKETKPYLRDLNDLITQTTESIELYNGIVSDQLNTYNTIVSNKMNQVMKVLTVFASIFIPLTFFAGIYGMNFKYMPELEYKFSYPVFWIIIILIGSGLLYFFKRKGWL
jgi:magnesium transporter